MQRTGFGTVVTLRTSVEMAQVKREKGTFGQYGAACPNWLRLELNLPSMSTITI
jgi:hypothetical protein